MRRSVTQLLLHFSLRISSACFFIVIMRKWKQTQCGTPRPALPYPLTVSLWVSSQFGVAGVVCRHLRTRLGHGPKMWTHMWSGLRRRACYPALSTVKPKRPANVMKFSFHDCGFCASACHGNYACVCEFACVCTGHANLGLELGLTQFANSSMGM